MDINKYSSKSIILILLSFLTLSCAYAISPGETLSNIDLIAPEGVYSDQEFNVSINCNCLSKYDLKIFIENSEKEIISEIFDEIWRNAFYYLKDKNPEDNIYTIRVSQSKISLNNLNQSNLCVRIRFEGSSKYKEECKSIKIVYRNSEDENPIVLRSKQEAYFSKEYLLNRSVGIFFVIFSITLAGLIILKKI